ncbi:unnamed protein product [Brassica oleracea var. botrytis]
MFVSTFLLVITQFLLCKVANCRPNILCLWPSNRGYDKRFGQTPGRLSVKKQMKLNC